jgi:hypothetical protein
MAENEHGLSARFGYFAFRKTDDLFVSPATNMGLARVAAARPWTSVKGEGIQADRHDGCRWQALAKCALVLLRIYPEMNFLFTHRLEVRR